MRRLLLALIVVVLFALAACSKDDAASSDGSNFASYNGLIEAANAAGFECANGIRLTGVGEWEQLQSRFAGLAELGVCVDDGDTHYLAVFTDATSLGLFVETEAWVDFERRFAPVADGQSFVGVAGKNWVITSYVPEDSFLEAIGARRVESQRASGRSPG